MSAVKIIAKTGNGIDKMPIILAGTHPIVNPYRISHDF